ncbi:predicted protein [Lichtheimia corymbifera JMRC:FSU:9682]|uniref:Uncharacterized protein n=1 Tax=Lichtheimia corymbifera JMRC:FSU:9682 TaxID=1263082 RepID=A0A068RX57_9FUNG|nr:predicted protein [Lichtheimia corymbifera JMRC:FSU:9682]
MACTRSFTTPAFLHTSPSLALSSTTFNRNSIHSSNCYQQDLYSIVSNSVHSLVTLLQHTLSCTHRPATKNVAAVAIISIFYSIDSSYLQQLALIQSIYNGWGVISAIKYTALQAIFTWFMTKKGLTSSRMPRREHIAAITWLSSTNMVDLMDGCNQVQ